MGNDDEVKFSAPRPGAVPGHTKGDGALKPTVTNFDSTETACQEQAAQQALYAVRDRADQSPA